SKEVFQLYHENDFALNEVYNFVTQFFEGIIPLSELSMQLDKHLYEASDHPKLKGGELHIVLFRNVQMEGEEHDAIGIFKTENKESVLQINPNQSGFQFGYIQDTISIDKLDKGAIIINSEAEEGYKVLISDSGKAFDAVNWKDDFLKVIARNDNYQQTGNFMKVYKNFVTEKLDETFELEKADKIDLLNRSMDYFKSKETFDQQEFEEEVIGNPDAISLFKSYQSDFEQEFETPLEDNFNISSSAVKKMTSSYKQIIKLDKNAHIFLHGKRELVERGYDEEKGLNFYKLY